MVQSPALFPATACDLALLLPFKNTTHSRTNKKLAHKKSFLLWITKYGVAGKLQKRICFSKIVFTYVLDEKIKLSFFDLILSGL